MKQVVNIKKIVVDSDQKVIAYIEFYASSAISKEFLCHLITLQGDSVLLSCEPVHEEKLAD